MSSIRPLAIITALTVLCIFLYMKINQTEPVLPADVAEWAMSPGLEIGSPALSADSVSSMASSSTADSAAPAFGAFPAGNEAPAYQPSSTPQSEAPAFDAAPVIPTLDVAGAPSFDAAPHFEADPVAASSLPDLPPLPMIPSVQTTSDAIAASTLPPEPITPTPSDAPSPNILSPQIDGAQSAAIPPANSPEQPPQESLFAATRLAVQAALDRGELSQALLLLSDWYGDPSLTGPENMEVDNLLSQLAGSVIYSKEHRLEPPHMVQAGQRLEEIAQLYNVPWQLLAKINGLSSPDELRPGQQLKVVNGPFSAVIDLSDRTLTLMLQRRYAGQFSIDTDLQSTIEEGHWQVGQKLLTPGNVGLHSSPATTPSDDRSLVLTNPSAGSGQVAVLHGPSAAASTATIPTSRGVQLDAAGIGEIFDILSLGSRVVIRR